MATLPSMRTQCNKEALFESGVNIASFPVHGEGVWPGNEASVNNHFVSVCELKSS